MTRITNPSKELIAFVNKLEGVKEKKRVELSKRAKHIFCE